MSTKLLVENISSHTTERAIAQVFGQDSRRVRSVAIAKDQESGGSHGFAFVEMATEADARAAIKALDRTGLDGRTVRVSEALEPVPAGKPRFF